jgi:hypothetical protein
MADVCRKHGISSADSRTSPQKNGDARWEAKGCRSSADLLRGERTAGAEFPFMNWRAIGTMTDRRDTLGRKVS